jgi:hypothetical protein
VIVTEGRVARVVFCFCHLAADFNVPRLSLYEMSPP